MLTNQAFLLVSLLFVLCLFQLLHVSLVWTNDPDSTISASSSSFVLSLNGWKQQQQQQRSSTNKNNNDKPTTKKQQQPQQTFHKNTNMSACLLVMDDTIKLTEWIAYHHTVLPLTHLIVAIDPASSQEFRIQQILEQWKRHLTVIEIWTRDTWMTLNSTEGWPPGAYNNENKTMQLLLLPYMKRIPPLWIHKRRQEHFVVRCLRRLKNIHPSWTAIIDTDEFVIYNYLDNDNENNETSNNNNNTFFLSDSSDYVNATIQERRRVHPIRATLLPKLGQVTIGEFLVSSKQKQRQRQQRCIKLPGLQITSKESPLSEVVMLMQQQNEYNDNNVLSTVGSTDSTKATIDVRTLMTMRHFYHGPKDGKFTKTLLDLGRIPPRAIQQDVVRTVHNPLAQICGKHANHFIGYDYDSSLLRIHHYRGTIESYNERLYDARRSKRSMSSFFDNKCNIVSSPSAVVGRTTDARPWLAAFLQKVGMDEAKRLLQPLKDAYQDTNWSTVWS